MRVRTFTQDDAHIFMLPEQVKSEIAGVIDFINYVYSIFGFKYHIELSTKPEDSMGTEEEWEMATNALKEALNEKGIPFIINEGDGAFYGPKIDFHLEDSIGRTWQCGTIQLDFQMPQRFDLTYVGKDGEKHVPIMIHRVIFGSVERFIGILTEHFAGKFPLWLAPVQVKLLTVTERFADFAEEVGRKLREEGLRVEVDIRNEKIGYKKVMQAPLMIVNASMVYEISGITINQVRVFSPIYLVLTALFLYFALIKLNINRHVSSLLMLIFLTSAPEMLILAKTYYNNII